MQKLIFENSNNNNLTFMNNLFRVLLISTVFLTGCSALKTVSILKKGEVKQKAFKVEIPFEFRLGLIVLKVSINGNEYDFLLDTGAPNVISTELAHTLNLDNKTSHKVGDSQGKDSELGFASIESINIGGINFLNTGAAISDLKKTKEIACLKVDGLLGANLMKNAIWKFDYENKLITITSSIDSLKLDAKAQKLPFSTKITGTPVFDVKLNDEIEKGITIDLGSNGDISLSNTAFDKLTKNNPSILQTSSFGNSTAGLYGYGDVDTTHYAIVPKISFGEVTLENTLVDFSKNSARTIGTKFFKNYEVIINWFDTEISLIEREKYNRSELSSFGFSVRNNNDTLIVVTIFNNSSAFNAGLKINDVILSIDDKEYGKIEPEEWCEIVENGIFDEQQNQTTITILRDNQTLKFDLTKTVLLSLEEKK